MTSPPDVSVVIAAYNAMPYLVKCVESVLEQSIGAERLEIIAVDDGSTDGTGEELDRFAARCPTMRVVHQENSGGPAQPRNVGLDLATGRYVFFLDADDWLGAEALERMVATADANGSDVVLGKMVGVGGRTVPLSMFRRNQPRTTVFDSNVYWALGPTKLFRRALLEDLGLRFDPRLTVGQDQPFTATAYLNASVISVVADYDCYYAVRRDDGGNNTSRPDGALRRLPFLRAVFDLLTREVEAGPKRDRLLRRHFQSDQREFLTHLLAETDPDQRAAVFEEFRGFVRAWCTEEVQRGMPAADRLRLWLIRAGRLDETLEVMRHTLEDRATPAVVEKGRVYGAYPYFRDPEVSAPDEVFDITGELAVRHYLSEVSWSGSRLRLRGHAAVDRLGGLEDGSELVLRERGSGVEHRLPVTRTAAEPDAPRTGGEDAPAGFAAVVDPARAADGAPLPRGLWDVFLNVVAQGVAKEARIGSQRSPEVPAGRQHRVVRPLDGLVTTYHTNPHGNLTLDVGGVKHPPPAAAEVTAAQWAPQQRATLLLSGSVDVVGPLRLRATDGDGRTVDLPVETAEDGSFTCALRLDDEEPLPFGTWSLALRPDAEGAAAPLLALQGTLPAAGRRWWRRARPVYAKVWGTRKEVLLTVAPVRLGAAVRRAVGLR